MGIENFVGTVVSDLANNDWSAHFSPEQWVFRYESRHMGYTEEDVGELWVALGHKHWLSVLVHEYAHFLIWCNRTRGQRTKSKNKYDPAFDLVEMWIKRKKKSTHRAIVGAAQTVVGEEARTELLALRIIRRYGLPINIDRYIQRATAYILTFGFVIENRQWTNPSAYKTEAVWSELPIDLKILKNPRAVLKNYRPYAYLFEKHCMEPWEA